MFEFILEAILWLIFEAILYAIFEIGTFLGIEAFKSRRKTANEISYFYAIWGLFSIGVVFGLITYWICPERILPVTGFTGASVFISPICAGVIMKAFGEWQEKRKNIVSPVATFWGGAVCAFGIALTRLIMMS